MRNEIKTSYCRIFNNKEGIIEIHFEQTNQIILDKKEFLSIKKAVQTISQSQVEYIFVKMSLFTNITKEALNIKHFKENEVKIGAIGVHISSLAQRLIAKFYFRFTKLSYKVKISTDENELREWLIQMKISTTITC